MTLVDRPMAANTASPAHIVKDSDLAAPTLVRTGRPLDRRLLRCTAAIALAASVGACETIDSVFEDVAGVFDSSPSAPTGKGRTASGGYPTLGGVPDRPATTVEERRAALQRGLLGGAAESGAYSGEDLRAGQQGLSPGQTMPIPSSPSAMAESLPPLQALPPLGNPPVDSLPPLPQIGGMPFVSQPASGQPAGGPPPASADQLGMRPLFGGDDDKRRDAATEVASLPPFGATSQGGLTPAPIAPITGSAERSGAAAGAAGGPGAPLALPAGTPADPYAAYYGDSRAVMPAPAQVASAQLVPVSQAGSRGEPPVATMPAQPPQVLPLEPAAPADMSPPVKVAPQTSAGFASQAAPMSLVELPGQLPVATQPAGAPPVLPSPQQLAAMNPQSDPSMVGASGAPLGDPLLARRSVAPSAMQPMPGFPSPMATPVGPTQALVPYGTEFTPQSSGVVMGGSVAGTPGLVQGFGGVRIGTIFFADGSAKLTAADRAVLRQMAAIHSRMGGVLRVVGHASHPVRNSNEVKRSVVNYHLSGNRADAVAQELLRLGVPASAVSKLAVADKQPEYAETRPTGEAGNRRVEVYLVQGGG